MSKIEWTDKTWNVITGCTQISPACDNCYAKAATKRLQGMARELLINYPSVSIDTAIQVFTHFVRYHRPKKQEISIEEALEVYKKAIKSFNCGYTIDRPKCERYYKDIMHHISMLEKIPIKNFIEE